MDCSLYSNAVAKALTTPGSSARVGRFTIRSIKVDNGGASTKISPSSDYIPGTSFGSLSVGGESTGGDANFRDRINSANPTPVNAAHGKFY